MILKRMTQNAGGDYCKSLRQRSWAALAILAIGLTGLGCYLWLVPGSGLSDHAQGLSLIHISPDRDAGSTPRPRRAVVMRRAEMPASSRI